MARGFPQRLVENLRRVDLAVIAREAPAHIGDQRLKNGPALRVPEHHAGTFLLEVKQVEFAAELAVVALLGLLDLLEISIEIFISLNALPILPVDVICGPRHRSNQSPCL